MRLKLQRKTNGLVRRTTSLACRIRGISTDGFCTRPPGVAHKICLALRLGHSSCMRGTVLLLKG
jgi:hypothetical protein